MAGHDYLSTACLHNVHPHCRLTCKFCDVLCRCDCHPADDTPPIDPPETP